MKPERAFWTFLSVAALARLAIAAIMPLSVDEAYAVTVSREPSWSFFDHPPLGFMLARFAAMLSGVETPFVLRLPYVALAIASTALLHDLTRRAFGDRAGVLAAAWFTIAPFSLYGLVTIVPDGPLIFFLLATTRIVLPLVAPRPDDPPADPRLWLLGGLTFGGALLSKYQAGLFAVAALVAILRLPHGRTALATRWPWLAGGIALACFFPVIAWNASHGFVSFLFQGGRAIGGETLLQPLNFFRTLLGQGAYLWPWTFVVAVTVLWRQISPHTPIHRLLRLLSLRVLLRKADSGAPSTKNPSPPSPSPSREEGAGTEVFVILATIPIAFFNAAALISPSSLPHWSMAGWVFALPLVGRWHAARGSAFPVASFSIVVALALLAGLHARTGALTAMLAERPSWDNTREFTDWDAVPAALAERGYLGRADVHVLALTWIDGAKIGAVLGGRIPVRVESEDPRHFQFLANPRPTRPFGVVVRAARAGQGAAMAEAVAEKLRARYAVVAIEPIIVQRRGGRPLLEFAVLTVAGRK